METRRAFLSSAGGALFAAMQTRAARAQDATALPTNPDVIVIGAGLAGLAAAVAAQVAGASVVVLEARERIGGRAFTETARYALPFDTGATFLHAAPRNPFLPIVRSLGFETIADTAAPRLVFEGADDNPRAQTAFDRALESFAMRINLAGTQGRDVAAAQVAPRVDRFDRIAHALNGPLSAGVETAALSTLDFWQQVEEKPQALVPQGLGAAVAAYGQGCPVSLSTPVTRIRWGTRFAEVTTPKGVLRAKAAVLTVPPALVAAGTIAFDPALPVAKQEAAASLPMGLLDKIVLPFRPRALAAETPRSLVIVDRDEPPAEVLLWPGPDISLAILHVGGEHARALEAGEPRAALAWAIDRMASAFGENLRGAQSGAGTFIRWGRDRWARGAFSAALPGMAQARDAWAAPLGGRLFFAGEAASSAWATTLAGAFESGTRAGSLAFEASRG